MQSRGQEHPPRHRCCSHHYWRFKMLISSLYCTSMWWCLGHPPKKWGEIFVSSAFSKMIDHLLIEKKHDILGPIGNGCISREFHWMVFITCNHLFTAFHAMLRTFKIVGNVYHPQQTISASLFRCPLEKHRVSNGWLKTPH